MKIAFHFVLFSIFLSACQDNKTIASGNKVIIPSDTFALMLSDLHIVDAASKQNYIQNNSNNLHRYSQNKAILNKYKVSKMRFDSTITFYSSHPKEFMVVYDSSLAILKRQLDAYTQQNLPVSAQPGKKPDSLEIKKQLENRANPFRKKD